MKFRLFKDVFCSMIAGVLIMLMLFGLLPLLPSGKVLAFKPVGSLRATPNDITHTDITEDAIKELIVNDNIVPDINRVGRTTQKAIDDIKWANARTDLGGEYFSDAGHFTGEAFAAGQQRLQTNFQGVISALQANDIADACENLGRALHALQDFMLTRIGLKSATQLLIRTLPTSIERQIYWQARQDRMNEPARVARPSVVLFVSVIFPVPD